MYQTVMVIDDSKLELFLAETMIRTSMFGEKIVACHTGEEALDYLRTNEHDPEKIPQVIFVDIYMPVMSGFDFLDKYTELSEAIRSRSKIIMFSSSQAHEDYMRMKQYPIIRKFLSKPLSLAMFNEIKESI
jgi:CheY-like chemotaxis protein